MATEQLVYIVDDEANVGEALSTLLRANGKRVQLFTSGQDFLDFARRDSCAGDRVARIEHPEGDLLLRAKRDRGWRCGDS